MKTPLASILYFLLASVLGAAGQFLYKEGAQRATGGLGSYVANTRILLGVVCYIAVMVLFVAAFKRGGSLSAAGPWPSSIPSMRARSSGRRSLQCPFMGNRSVQSTWRVWCCWSGECI
jgi:hypothetical protein